MSNFELIPPSPFLIITLSVLTYVCLQKAIMFVPKEPYRKALFVAINIIATTAIFVLNVGAFKLFDIPRLIGTYVLAVIGLFVITRMLAFGKEWWVAALAPILLLVIGRYAPFLLLNEPLGWLGLSYMAFRLSQLVVVVRNKIVPMPGVLDYLGFAFFTPTILVGPINSYSTFHKSYYSPNAEITPPGRCFLRILIGATKLLFFGSIFERLSYSGLLLDGRMHAPVDLLIAAIAYYFYLFCNFSGLCDIAIGAAGLIGIKVSENFNQPFAARNIKEFWNRWHMTLSGFMRDMFFSPVSKFLVSKVPEALAPHAIALTIAMVFILIGIWHGKDLHYLAWGLLHAAAMVWIYYYGILLKKYLTRDQLRWYNNNRYVRYTGVAITFIFICISLFLFANTFPQMQEIFRVTQLSV